jgi:hypothetical protein
MTKKRVNMKSKSTNVRYIKARQRGGHLLLTVLWYLAPGTTKNMLLERFFKPISYAPTPLEIEYLEKGWPFHIHVRNKKIRCWKWGYGPAILFVHGWNGRGVNFVYFFKGLINAGYSVITYDGPAHGDSDGRVTNYFELTDAVRSFFDPSRGLDIRGVIAHSLGASAVINSLSKDNSPVDVVLIAPALKLKEVLFNVFNQHGVPETVYQNLIAEMEAAYGYDVHQDNPYRLAKRISSKMLIVHDTDDRTIPYLDSKVLAEKKDHVVLHTTHGLGHNRILRDKTVVDVITNHIFNGQQGIKLFHKEEKNERHSKHYRRVPKCGLRSAPISVSVTPVTS